MIAELLIAVNLFTTPTHTITPQIHKSQIELNNQYYNISEKALVPNFNPGTGHNVVVQNYIDKGLIATAYNHFAKDGKPTYIAGHNPGALSGVARDIKMGSIVTGYDNEGNAYKYKITNHMIVPLNSLDMLQSYADYILYQLPHEEKLVIQYCIGNEMILWYGDLIN